VVFEKPFGSDLASATILAEQLAASLGEPEIFRVDHYLSKPGVLQMAPFVTANVIPLRRLKPLSLEIAILETEDCEYVLWTELPSCFSLNPPMLLSLCVLHDLHEAFTHP
jgi:hypothetical protein